MHDQNRKKNVFLKNKAGKLLKKKDEPKKQTGNKAETNLAMLLKTKTRQKTNQKQTKDRMPFPEGRLQTGFIVPFRGTSLKGMPLAKAQSRKVWMTGPAERSGTIGAGRDGNVVTMGKTEPTFLQE